MSLANVIATGSDMMLGAIFQYLNENDDIMIPFLMIVNDELETK